MSTAQRVENNPSKYVKLVSKFSVDFFIDPKMWAFPLSIEFNYAKRDRDDEAERRKPYYMTFVFYITILCFTLRFSLEQEEKIVGDFKWAIYLIIDFYYRDALDRLERADIISEIARNWDVSYIKVANAFEELKYHIEAMKRTHKIRYRRKNRI